MMAFIKKDKSVSDNKKEYIAVGGQALMEGIMMRGPKGTAMSLRMPDGSIKTEMKNFSSLRKKSKLFNTPVIRGIVSFIESMAQGYKLLMESAEKTMLFDEDEDRKQPSSFMSTMGAVGALLGILISFFLFMWAPSFLFDFINDKLVQGAIEPLRAIFEGFLRVVIFILYMYMTSKAKDIRRVYMYHGAEHKTIFCFEHGKELTVENIKKEKRFHPRCGTSFIFVTIILSIIISSIVSLVFPVLTESRLVWILIKFLMMPFIMGIGFECIQLAGKYQNKFTRLLSAPGLLMQRITTVEPADDMIEVAIAAVKVALAGKVEEPAIKLSKQKFIEKYCHNCGSQRCEGIDTDWFDGCQHKDELFVSEPIVDVDELDVAVKTAIKNETHNEFIKKGAEKLCKEHPDIVQDIINS